MISRRSARNAQVEIITRGERRRSWTLEQKREIVAGSYGPELTPTEVARKHGISSGQLYTWRQATLGVGAAVVTRVVPQFAEVELADTPAPVAATVSASGSVEALAAPDPKGRMEIVLAGDIVVRVDAQVDGAALRRVLDAFARR